MSEGQAADPTADVALLEEAEAVLEGLDVALRRLEDGSYGTCELCADPLDPDELRARPLTRRCASHAAAGGSGV
jgi:DnaK suppressor protein